MIADGSAGRKWPGWATYAVAHLFKVLVEQALEDMPFGIVHFLRLGVIS
jgi:hypothetical protein